MDFFKKVSLKDIIGDEDFFRPRKMDIMKEENIVFHLNNDSSNMVTTLTNGATLESLGVGAGGEENEIDFEKQKQIE